MATMGKSKFLLSKSKERFRGRARSMRRGVGGGDMMPRSHGNDVPREDNNSSNELSSSSASPYPEQQYQQPQSISNQQYQHLQYFNDQAMYHNQNSHEMQYGQQQPQFQQSQFHQYPQNQPPELQYIQTLQYVRQDELQLQQWNQAQTREQLERQGGMMGSDETSLAYSHQTYSQHQPGLSGNLMPVDEQALQQLLQRQQYEHEQEQVRMRQEQMRQQEQLRWQHQQLREQQEKLRQQEQARQKQELHIHQQQMRQQQQIRNQKIQHQQRRQYQVQQQQQQFPEQQQTVEQESHRDQMKQQEPEQQKTQKAQQMQPQEQQLIKQVFVEEDKQEKKERPMKIRKRCWQRQQKLLDMQDDWESVYELENTITRPASKRNLSATKTKESSTPDDSTHQQAGVALNVGSIADALALLAVASRLKVPEHLAETLTKFSMLSQAGREYTVRHAIASRQEQKNVAEDFAAVNHSMSLNTCSTGYTGNGNYPHARQESEHWSPNVNMAFPSKSYTKKEVYRKTSTSTSTSSDSSHSVGADSTMTSRRDTFDDSNQIVASTSTSEEKEVYSPRSGQSFKQKSGSPRKASTTKDEFDAVSANLQGLSVSVSYEDDEDDDASDVAITPQNTGISSHKPETIEPKKSASSRSQKQDSKQSRSSTRSKRQLETHNVPSAQATMTIDGTLTSPSTFDIKHIGSGQASVGLSALSYPSTQARTEDDTTYPSLQPTDAFTVSSRKIKNAARAPSRKGHSPSPSSVHMSYTLSETEESVTSMRRNHQSNNSMTGAPSVKSRRSRSVKNYKASSKDIDKSRSSKSQRDSKASSKENGKSKSSKALHDTFSSKSSKTGPKEKEHGNIAQRHELEEDYESYATSNAPIQPADSRRKYNNKTSSGGYSSSFEKDSNILFALEEGPLQSDDDVTVQTGTSERFATDVRTLKDKSYPDVEYDLSRPLSSEYEDASLVESEVREKPSSPRRHPAMADYEASNKMLQEEEESMSSLVSAEHSFDLSLYRPRKKRDDVLYSNRNSLRKRQSLDSWSKSNNLNPDTIRSAYATMTKALRPDKQHQGHLVSGERHLDIDPQLSGCGFQFERRNNEDEEDLDQWLESAMATKSFDEGCTLDARQFGDADDGDLDAWLDNVICS